MRKFASDTRHILSSFRASWTSWLGLRVRTLTNSNENCSDPDGTPDAVRNKEFAAVVPARERARRLRSVLDEAAGRSDWGTP